MWVNVGFVFMRGIQKVLLEGVQLGRFVVFYEDLREDPNTTMSRSSLACQRNDIEMAFCWRSDDGPTLNAIPLCDFSGGGGPDLPSSPLWTRACYCGIFWSYSLDYCDVTITISKSQYLILLLDWGETCLLIGPIYLHKSLCLPGNWSKPVHKLILHENQLELVSRS